MSIEDTQSSKRLKGYYWLAFVISGMVAGFLGCLVYARIAKGDHSLLSGIAGNPKTDKPIVQTALTVAEAVSPSAFLGVEIMSVDAVIAEQLSLPGDCGVLVTSVIDGSPAQKAGLQRGDVILSLNNIAVKDVDGFREIMAELNPGDDVRIIYIRDGQKDTAYATLAQPLLFQTLGGAGLANSSAVLETAQESESDWGVSLAVLSSDLRTSLRIPANINGIVLLSVMPGGLADRSGLQSGDVITGIDNTPIASMNDFFTAIESGDDNIALLDIYSKNGLRFVALDSSAVAAVAQQRQPNLVDRLISIFTDDDNVILTEHINEEDDYEKPVCKRLEESGERYEQ